MIQILVLCIGKTNESYVKEGLLKYQKLLGKYCKLEFIELPDVKKGSSMNAEQLKQAEMELFLPYLNPKTFNIFLDEIGQQMNSEQLADYLEKKTVLFSKINLIIGGAYGLSSALKTKGDSLALSKMTFNHQMVRVILLEQVFRAFTIIKKTGYHH